MQIRYISYGTSKTGGYRHEKCLFDSCLSFLAINHKIEAKLIRKNQLFESPKAHIYLMLWAFIQSSGDINIVTARTGVSAILRNLFNKKQVWIVLHNYDANDHKSISLKWYYQLLFFLLRKQSSERIKTVVVASYWKRFFEKEIGLPNVFIFPNLFDTLAYEKYQSKHKNNWVHLGQFSSKNDAGIFPLAEKLSAAGYYCYFSTLNQSEAQESKYYDILYFPKFNEYLEHVSRSICTLALSRINEGWNRVAHESMLLGTPVIGYNAGGLGDLLKESKSMVVNSVDEVYECITQNLFVQPSSSFTEKYDLKNFAKYTIQICPN
jgi:glycosyltransferase involved in cell wall biosynthesis